MTHHSQQIIAEQLDDLEDLYQAERRLEDVMAGRSETIGLDDFLRERDLLQPRIKSRFRRKKSK